MSNLEERVKKIIVEQLGVDEAEVKNEASFVDDLGADSLDDEAEKITTVQAAIDYVTSAQ